MRRDLALVVTLACAAFLAAVLQAPTLPRAVLLIPLVLFLPGYATAACLFARSTVTRTERLVYAIVLSIAIAAVGGLAIQLALDLGRDVWAGCLAGVTAVAALLAAPAEPRGTIPWPTAIAWKLPLAVLAFAAAIAIAALSIVSADEGVREAQAKIRFTSFWLLPQGTARVQVGLRSHEGRPTGYRLRISRGGRVLASQDLRLRSGQQWERGFALEAESGNAPVVAALRRDGSAYRRLDLTPSR